MKNTEQLLQSFKGIGLSEVDSLGLLRRVDRKYAFHISLLPKILIELQSRYSCLEVEGRRLNHYSTLYFDTPDYRFYRDHHRGKLNRFKIRRRTYTDSGLQFFEVKIKTNTGYTDKKRVNTTSNKPALENHELEFTQKWLKDKELNLQPVLSIEYDRMAFVSKDSVERISIDLNLTFAAPEEENIWEGMVIAELKTERNRSSIFSQLMKSFKIPSVPLSKYCMSVAITKPELAKNNFKENLYFIQKQLQHANPSK